MITSTVEDLTPLLCCLPSSRLMASHKATFWGHFCFLFQINLDANDTQLYVEDNPDNKVFIKTIVYALLDH